MNQFRIKTPIRSDQKQYKQYRTYKKHLKKDFNNRCGYCNCECGVLLGGTRVFHVDHFAPWKRFESTYPKIKVLYINLVYSCPYCNGLKSDDWVSNSPFISIVGNKGYIDPCKPEYDAAFARNNLGEIIPLTAVAEYMYEQIGLGLERHGIIWQLEETKKVIRELLSLAKSVDIPETIKLELKTLRLNIHDSYYIVFDELDTMLK